MTHDPLPAKDAHPTRGGPSFSLGNRIERTAWIICWTVLGRLVPPPFGHGWRRVLLRLFGAQIARGATIYPSARIWLPRNLSMGQFACLGPEVQCYNMARITIGRDSVVSQRSFLCSGDHDHRDPHFQLVTAPIRIGNSCWIAAEAYIGPGITVGDRAIVAARGCVVKDIPANTVWGGNPACQIGERAAAN